MTTRKASGPLGHLYSLVKTVQFDVVLGDDSFALRIELFQDAATKRMFHADIWRNEFYRIQSTFPQNPSTSRPKHHPSDEVILIDWSTNVSGDYSVFDAANSTVALNLILEDIRNTLDRIADGTEWRR